MARRKEKTPEYFTVEVERLDQEGRGVGHHDGKVVFIEGALPGELVTYERIRNQDQLRDRPRRPFTARAFSASSPVAPSSATVPAAAAAAPCAP